MALLIYILSLSTSLWLVLTLKGSDQGIWDLSHSPEFKIDLKKKKVQGQVNERLLWCSFKFQNAENCFLRKKNQLCPVAILQVIAQQQPFWVRSWTSILSLWVHLPSRTPRVRAVPWGHLASPTGKDRWIKIILEDMAAFKDRISNCQNILGFKWERRAERGWTHKHWVWNKRGVWGPLNQSKLSWHVAQW